MKTATRKIIHIDCDCFYAAVEMHDDPALRQRPVAVGGDPGRRGVIATCNYTARAEGVRSAMPSSLALRLCPDLVIVPPRFERYRQISAAIRQIMEVYTDIIEPLSLDEAFLDVSECEQFNNSATRIAMAIREEVQKQLGITVSAGVAPNKFLAKIASDWRKPDGLFVIPPDQVSSFVTALPVDCIFGVGRVTHGRLNNLGIHTCGDLQTLPRLELSKHFGSFGERLYHLARGEDDRPVQSSRRRKSVSVEQTFDKDCPNLDHWLFELPELLERLKQRLARLDNQYLVGGLTAKVKYDDFVVATCDGIGKVELEDFQTLLAQLWERRSAPARLLGIGVRLNDMNTPQQPDLFPREREAALALQRSRQL